MLRVKSDKSDWLRIIIIKKILCVSSKIGPSKRSRWFLVLTKRRAAPGDENSPFHTVIATEWILQNMVRHFVTHKQVWHVNLCWDRLVFYIHKFKCLTLFWSIHSSHNHSVTLYEISHLYSKGEKEGQEGCVCLGWVVGGGRSPSKNFHFCVENGVNSAFNQIHNISLLS